MLVKVTGKDTDTVVSALIGQVAMLPASLRSTLTWDRGMELADHKRLAAATGFSVYFCDPRTGSAERTRTPTSCFANTCRRRPSCPSTAKATSTRSPPDSTTGLARRLATPHRQIGSGKLLR